MTPREKSYLEQSNLATSKPLKKSTRNYLCNHNQEKSTFTDTTFKFWSFKPPSFLFPKTVCVCVRTTTHLYAYECDLCMPQHTLRSHRTITLPLSLVSPCLSTLFETDIFVVLLNVLAFKLLRTLLFLPPIFSGKQSFIEDSRGFTDIHVMLFFFFLQVWKMQIQVLRLGYQVLLSTEPSLHPASRKYF